MLQRAVHSHVITSRHGAPLKIKRDAGLIVEVTDGDTLGYRVNLFYDLAKNAVIRLAHAMALLADREIRDSRAKGPKRVLRELGPHPGDGAPVWLKTSHYGPFVAHRRAYAPVPEDIAPDALTLERALALLGGVPGRRRRGRERGCRRSGLVRVAGPGHAVADAAHVEDPARALRVVAELVAQPLDVGAHDLGIAVGPLGPDLAQQRLVGGDPTGGWRGYIWNNYGNQVADCARQATKTNRMVKCSFDVHRL